MQLGLVVVRISCRPPALSLRSRRAQCPLREDERSRNDPPFKHLDSGRHSCRRCQGATATEWIRLWAKAGQIRGVRLIRSGATAMLR